MTEFLVHTYAEQGTSTLFLYFHICPRRQTLLRKLFGTFHLQAPKKSSSLSCLIFQEKTKDQINVRKRI